MGDHHHGPPRASRAGCLRPTTRTSARCTCGSPSPCFCSAASSRWLFAQNCSSPVCSLVEPAFFNQMTTLHGLVMVFGAIMPSFVGLANWLIPMMIGAPDMALAAHEQLEFLDLAARFSDAGVNAVYGRRCAGFWLDFLCAAINHLRAAIGDLLYFRHPHSWACRPSWARSISLPP